MKHLLLVVLSLFSLNALAGIDSRSIRSEFDSLPEAAKLEIAKQIQTASEANATTLKGAVTNITSSVPTVTPEKVNAWAESGKNIGVAIGSAAKELGLAADSFMKTDTGRIAMVVILWKVMGKESIQIVGGFLFFFVAAGIWVHIYRRTCLIKSVTVSPVQLKFLGIDLVRYKTEVNYDKKPADAEQFFLGLIGLGILVLSAAIIFH